MRSKFQAWARAFARQAEADWNIYQQLESETPSKPICHRLLFLQMSCEKLVKSHLALGGMDPESNKFRVHTWIKRRLGEILKNCVVIPSGSHQLQRSVMKNFKHLAQEIERLNPAADDNKQRPENCEYPWSSGDQIILPLEHAFSAVDLLDKQHGLLFKKALKKAIDDQVRTTTTE